MYVVYVFLVSSRMESEKKLFGENIAYHEMWCVCIQFNFWCCECVHAPFHFLFVKLSSNAFAPVQKEWKKINTTKIFVLCFFYFVLWYINFNVFNSVFFYYLLWFWRMNLFAWFFCASVFWYLFYCWITFMRWRESIVIGRM